jgi:hypothetical protein
MDSSCHRICFLDWRFYLPLVRRVSARYKGRYHMDSGCLLRIPWSASAVRVVRLRRCGRISCVLWIDAAQLILIAVLLALFLFPVIGTGAIRAVPGLDDLVLHVVNFGAFFLAALSGVKFYAARTAHNCMFYRAVFGLLAVYGVTSFFLIHYVMRGNVPASSPLLVSSDLSILVFLVLTFRLDEPSAGISMPRRGHTNVAGCITPCQRRTRQIRRRRVCSHSAAHFPSRSARACGKDALGRIGNELSPPRLS